MTNIRVEYGPTSKNGRLDFKKAYCTRGILRYTGIVGLNRQIGEFISTRDEIKIKELPILLVLLAATFACFLAATFAKFCAHYK